MLEDYSASFVATPGAIGQNGSLANPFRIFLQSLWNRTGKGTGIPLEVAVGLVASGSTQADALELNVDLNKVETVPAGSGAVLLPLQVGQWQSVWNADAGSLNVYPAPGYAINALAANAPFVLAAGAIAVFTAYTPTTLQTGGSGAGASLGNAGFSISNSTTVSSATAGQTLVLSGTSATALMQTLTFGPPSGYGANFQVMVVNADTRGWSIAPTGQAAFTLWPGQSKIVFVQNGVWYWTPHFERYRSDSAIQINVDPAGNDANDGLGTGTGAKKTLLSAWNDVQTLTDGEVFIQLVRGGHFSPSSPLSDGSSFGVLTGDKTAGTGSMRNIVIQGDPNQVNPPILTVLAGTLGIVMRDGGWATLNGLSFLSSGSGATAISAQQYGGIDLLNMKYDAFPGGVHVSASDGTQLNVSGAELISGAALIHWSVTAQSKLLVGNVTITGFNLALNFADGFVLASALSRISTLNAVNYNQCGSFTGGGYALSRHSIFEANGGAAPPGGAGTQDATSNFYA